MPQLYEPLWLYLVTDFCDFNVSSYHYFLSKLSIYFNLFLQNSANFIRGSLILVQIFCNSGIILMKNIPVF